MVSQSSRSIPTLSGSTASCSRLMSTSAGGLVRWHSAARKVWRDVTMAQAELNDGQRLMAVNDLFIGARTHVSARYRLRYQGREEDQSSSGLIVSTGAGSTGWHRSVTYRCRGDCCQLPGDRPISAGCRILLDSLGGPRPGLLRPRAIREQDLERGDRSRRDRGR